MQSISGFVMQEGGSNNDAGTVNRADYGTIVHKRKLVLELTQRGFRTNRPSRWLALYGYLRRSVPVVVGGGCGCGGGW